ncbi:hypothetical protein BDV25DRAFT_137156 [Aspergillus avenaceus]|uniref:2-oxoadipate dioxygenase/decarboxylase n=1 Tax=Aspergillus avenaceus TaxID=36643 RepID=A0A5N6U3B6_ASPAV|nr:hypothetical protein BDV25DRAFT_137156 [Aspergillus avenaceus]
MAVKSRIEGRPLRKCPVLLRQTSFLALEETIQFRVDSVPGEDYSVTGRHKARFGEIKERGAAVTPKARELYDHLLAVCMTRTIGVDPKEVDAIVGDVLRQYPDDWRELRQQGLIDCEFRCIKRKGIDSLPRKGTPSLLEQLTAEGFVEATPVTYEDFLPSSAAGIFQSNLRAECQVETGLNLQHGNADPKGFERAS